MSTAGREGGDRGDLGREGAKGELTGGSRVRAAGLGMDAGDDVRRGSRPAGEGLR